MRNFLKLFCEWLKVNGLPLNVDKNCYMTICNKEIEGKRVGIAGNVIKSNDKVKFLGILMDDRLYFKDRE